MEAKVYISEGIYDFDLAEALAELSEQRREQALRFKHEEGQRLSVRAYLLLRQALREQYAITETPIFEYAEHGKPAIVGHPDIHFNLSHCRRAVACAVSNRPIGIDVESVRKYKESLVSYTMNDEEIRQIAADPRPDVAFTRLWTKKEAALKLTGQGITSDLKMVLSDTTLRFETVVAEDQSYVYTACWRG